MTLAEIIGLLAGAFSVGGYIPYCIAIWNSNKKDNDHEPKLSTWIIWTISSWLLFISGLYTSNPETIYVAGAYAIGATATLLICIKNKSKGWDTFDSVCIVFSMISVLLWWYYRVAFIALVINLAIDVIGAIPTLRSAMKNPEKENKLAWKLWYVGTILNVLALIILKEMRLEKVLYSITMFLLVSTVSYFVFMRKNKSHISDD